MKALVIGGTGPAGPSVVEGLRKRRYEVTILHRGTHETKLPTEVEHIHRDPHFLESLQQALNGRSFDLTIAMYGRLRLTAQVMQERTTRFISVGGVAVYRGWLTYDPSATMRIPVTEGAPLQTSSQIDKLSYRMAEAEQVVMDAHHAGYYNATHFRYPTVYGPRQVFPMEWSIIRRILDGRTRLILPGDGLNIESRGYAENMAHALLLAVDKPQESSGQIYNVRDETLLTLRDWVNTICHMLDHRFEFVEMPYSLVHAAWPYSWHAHHQIVDISKAQRELGYCDVVPAEKGIERTVNWYLENPPLAGGEAEQRLRDPFDYDAEDRLINAFLEAMASVKAYCPPEWGFHHPYDHPKPLG